jgi:zinc protease
MTKIDPAVDEELARLIQEGVTKKEVDDAIDRLQNHAAFARDNFGTAARVFGVALTSGGSIDEVESWPARIAEVTPEAVVAAAKHVFQGAFHVTSELLPKPQS